MATVTKSIWERQEELKQEPIISFRQSGSDLGHFDVNRFRGDGGQVIMGHIYTEVKEEEIFYISTNSQGREIFPRTTDFNSVEQKFERYARLLALQEFAKENSIELQEREQELSDLRDSQV